MTNWATVGLAGNGLSQTTSEENVDDMLIQLLKNGFSIMIDMIGQGTYCVMSPS